MNSKSSEEQNETPSKEIVEALGWKEVSPGVYIGGEECSPVNYNSGPITIDPSVWDEKLDLAEAEAAELVESSGIPELVEGAEVAKSTESNGAEGTVESSEDESSPFGP
jgi:hypothetical protein